MILCLSHTRWDVGSSDRDSAALAPASTGQVALYYLDIADPMTNIHDVLCTGSRAVVPRCDGRNCRDCTCPHGRR